MGSGIPLQVTQWGIDVKESTKSNIYEANGRLVWDLYADYVSGSRSTLACSDQLPRSKRDSTACP